VKWELFDLEKDPLELRSVYGLPEYAEITARLKEELYALKEQFGDKM